jgi:hypothetical protein
MGSKCAGMTVNERLYASGLMYEFDRAVNERNVDRVCEILAQVGLNEESIKPILEHLQLCSEPNNCNERYTSFGADCERLGSLSASRDYK